MTKRRPIKLEMIKPTVTLAASCARDLVSALNSASDKLLLQREYAIGIAHALRGVAALEDFDPLPFIMLVDAHTDLLTIIHDEMDLAVEQRRAELIAVGALNPPDKAA